MCEQAFSDRCLISEIDLRDFGPLAWDWCGTVFSFDIVLDSSELLPSLQGGKAGVCLSRQQSKAAEAWGGLTCLPRGISLCNHFYWSYVAFPSNAPVPHLLFLIIFGSSSTWYLFAFNFKGVLRGVGIPQILEEYSGKWRDDSVGAAHTQQGEAELKSGLT